MRLIDADLVLENIKPYELSDEDWCVTGGTAIRLIHNAIDGAPTIDAVPVVRCKDCKHWLNDFYGCTEFVGCCAYANYMIGANGYCIYGERKEGVG